jgi:hypothetical protein
VSAILRDLPYSDQPSTVEVRGRTFAVKRDQIILWISLSEKGLGQLDPRTPRFPAILDTGCNCNLLINQRQLATWAGIHPQHLPKLSSLNLAGERLSQFAANVWLHPNVRGQRDEFGAGPPYQLELLPGIAVYPARQGRPLYPRLPLLGLRTFRLTGLQVCLDCHRLRLTIRTPHRFWPFRRRA